MLSSKLAPRNTVRPATLEATDEAAELIGKRLSPGMLVLAPPLRLIHMNQAAWEYMQRLTDDEGTADNGAQPRKAKGLLPGPLREACLDIMRHLQDRPNAKDWERFEMKRLVGLPKRPILLRGFGIPDPSEGNQSRVVLLLEEVGRRREPLRQAAVEQFRLTERERAVVECLGKGWTNKEIAGALGLALPTVKEHIRHIMEKTKTSTRTGILVQIFHK